MQLFDLPALRLPSLEGGRRQGEAAHRETSPVELHLARSQEGHHFCPTCSTPIMRGGYPDNKISINARCIEGVDVFTLEIERYDGRNDMFPGPLP
ncbi:hypothetical protein [Sinorhizobium sp. NFACC03]|jgi:hypothetical protein|uniref:hypothetical protein n=1 Tax=Sinorhizobium sp. NFACC03 TaxID=1566295 RepID=UPI002570C2A7|nr:hypothetical protein [Sinorhizobium sp. NFACC03]